MEKELNKDYKKIIKFVNELHRDLKHNKLNTKKLNNLKKDINIQKLNVLKKQLNKQKGGVTTNKTIKLGELPKNLQNLIQYGTMIDTFSVNLKKSVKGLSTILQNFPIILDKKGIDNIVSTIELNNTQSLIQSGGEPKMSKNFMQQMGLEYIKSMVYMSQVIQYISLWVNNVNNIIINNQLGMSDKCLDNTKLLMQSLGELTKAYPQVPSPTQVIGTR